VRRLINQHPGRGEAIALGFLPFLAVLAVYILFSQWRLAANADDKLLPSLAKIGAAVHSYAFEEDLRSGRILWWADTWAASASDWESAPSLAWSWPLQSA
jgi:NitT/TauT family transport system permease protein